MRPPACHAADSTASIFDSEIVVLTRRTLKGNADLADASSGRTLVRPLNQFFQGCPCSLREYLYVTISAIADPAV